MIKFSTAGIITQCKQIENYHETVYEAVHGEIVGIHLMNISVKDINRGEIISNAKNDPA